MADATFTRLENKIWFENLAEMRGEIIGFFIITQITKPRLCSVLSQSTYQALERSRSGEKHSTTSRIFPYTSFVLYCFQPALQQNRAQSGEASLFVKYCYIRFLYAFTLHS